MTLSAGLNRMLRPWQDDAIRAWLAEGSRGIIEAATGTGKTVTALAALHAMDDGRLRVVIVVPRIALVDQWVEAIRDNLGIPTRHIGALGGGCTPHGQDVVVAVINSARKGLAPIVNAWHSQGCHTLLIVDECHWAGSQVNAQIFESGWDHTLGLSATPERSDDGLTEVLEPQLGPVVFRYPLRQALDDGILSPLLALDLYIDMNNTERAEYESLTDQIRQRRLRLENEYPQLAYAGGRWFAVLQQLASSDEEAEKLQLQLFQRRRLLAALERRQECLDDILTSGLLDRPKSILFHDTIDSAERTFGQLRELGHDVYVDHSARPPDERRASLQSFRFRPSAFLVAVRTMDEGIDVPDADATVIVSGTLTARQRIQRIGRILRPSGTRALCVSILARETSEETSVGARDGDLLGPERVRHHRWPEMRAADLGQDRPSSYAPNCAATGVGTVDHSDLDAWPSRGVPRACPNCGYRPSGTFATCARCGEVLDPAKAQRMAESARGNSDELHSPRQSGTRSVSNRQRQSVTSRSAADDPNYRRCAECGKYIKAALAFCPHCGG